MNEYQVEDGWSGTITVANIKPRRARTSPVDQGRKLVA